jgi:hypothetical protein
MDESMTQTHRSVSLRAPTLALSAALLGMALHLTDGLYSPIGIGVLTLSLILCIAAVLTPHAVDANLPNAEQNRISPRTFHLFLTGLVAIQLFSMLFVVAGATEATVPKVSQRPYQMGVAIAACGLAMIAASSQRKGMWIGFVVMAATFAGIGVWKIRSAPSPFIDVFIFHRDAAEALAKGTNPYTITFPNIYGPTTYVYGPGVVQDGRLLFGYPYPPLVLMLTSASHWIFEDARYAMLVSMLVSAVMIALIRRDRAGMLIAMLLLFTPRAFYILELAWTEPISVMLLAAAVLVATRGQSAPASRHSHAASGDTGDFSHAKETEKPSPSPPYSGERQGEGLPGATHVRAPQPASPLSTGERSLGAGANPDIFADQGDRWRKLRSLAIPALLGLLLASKQYLPATILLFPLLEPKPRSWKRVILDIVIACAAAAVVTLPLALWDFRAFWQSAITLQMRQPYRPDALSFLAWWGYGRTGWTGPFWLAFVALFIAAMLSLWRLPRGIAGFVMGFAFTYYCFFAFNKQAFANYYYLVLGALCITTALQRIQLHLEPSLQEA